MIKIEGKANLQTLKSKLSPALYRFIYNWYRERNDNQGPQDSLYGSPHPIGSLGAVWIAESEDDVTEKEFMELIQFQIQKQSIFIGTFIPTNGEECADIFIPADVLSQHLLNRFTNETDQIINLD